MTGEMWRIGAFLLALLVFLNFSLFPLELDFPWVREISQHPWSFPVVMSLVGLSILANLRPKSAIEKGVLLILCIAWVSLTIYTYATA